MRLGESLVAMSPDQIRSILDETFQDFTSEICVSATISDLDVNAIDTFRAKWHKRTNNSNIASISDVQLLEDAELTVDGRLTYAALILLGNRAGLGRYLPQAELVFEYKSAEHNIRASQRVEYRQGFLAYNDDLWREVNSRNETTSIREGLFRTEIPAFNEDAVREAILNGICHRDYRLQGSVFVRLNPGFLAVTSPGGFPDGVNPSNVLRKQVPRNRRLAEACGKCGLVERAGQGMDTIFDKSLREGKGEPDFEGTDMHEVVIRLHGRVLDSRFVELLDLASKRGFHLTVEHLIILERIRQSGVSSQLDVTSVKHLIDIGLVELSGRGKKIEYHLSRGMYKYLGEPGSYTRKKGLDRETNKQLLVQHVKNGMDEGATFNEFRQVLPSLNDRQIRQLVYELRDEEKIVATGHAKAARWFLHSDFK